MHAHYRHYIQFLLKEESYLNTIKARGRVLTALFFSFQRSCMFSFFCSMSLKVRVIQNTLSMQTCYEQSFFYSYFRSHFPVSVWVKNLSFFLNDFL